MGRVVNVGSETELEAGYMSLWMSNRHRHRHTDTQTPTQTAAIRIHSTVPVAVCAALLLVANTGGQ